jgi:hypothetical protein
MHAFMLWVQNEDAEELMRHVEHEEEAAAQADPDSLQLHLCIINLVIGTLYCSKVPPWSPCSSFVANTCLQLAKQIECFLPARQSASCACGRCTSGSLPVNDTQLML